MPAKAAEPDQTPEQVATALESYLADYPAAVVMEDGKVLFDMRLAKYTLATEHARCTLQLWSDERNLVRRVSAAVVRGPILRLSTWRFGQTRPQLLELAGDRDRRTPSTREAVRARFVRELERALERQFPEWKPDSFRTAMDLEKSFGPAYARGLLVQGQKAWAVIAVNGEESQATIDGILTLGILWLETCRELAGGRRVLQGLKLVLPQGMSTLTRSRVAWLAGAHWQVWELDPKEGTLELRDPADQGNLRTRLVHLPDPERARERFSVSAERVLAMVPEAARAIVEQRLRTAAELAFLLHGLEFARVRIGSSAESFNRVEEISFGTGANETVLTAANEDALRRLVEQLFLRRSAAGNKRDPLYRMQPERWLEGELRRNVRAIDTRLDPAHVHTQVGAVAAGDRGLLDLLAVADDGRLAVLEVKADEDLHLALQGLDYWIRVRAHHAGNPDPVTGLGEFQRNGYFSQVQLSPADPRLYLVAPALRIHPATQTVLRHFSPRVEWTLVALDERWRHQVKVVWRKRNTDPRPL